MSKEQQMPTTGGSFVRKADGTLAKNLDDSAEKERARQATLATEKAAKESKKSEGSK